MVRRISVSINWANRLDDLCGNAHHSVATYPIHAPHIRQQSACVLYVISTCLYKSVYFIHFRTQTINQMIVFIDFKLISSVLFRSVGLSDEFMLKW